MADVWNYNLEADLNNALLGNDTWLAPNDVKHVLATHYTPSWDGEWYSWVVKIFDNSFCFVHAFRSEDGWYSDRSYVQVTNDTTVVGALSHCISVARRNDLSAQAFCWLVQNEPVVTPEPEAVLTVAQVVKKSQDDHMKFMHLRNVSNVLTGMVNQFRAMGYNV